LLGVIENAPLVSIDLLVTDEQGRLLVGRRVNEPARGSLFVPGGRIRKGERHDEALTRIAEDEVGLKGLEWRDENVVGIFTHVYDTNAFDAPGVSTHYVVVGYRVQPGVRLELPHGEQHSEYRWIGPTDTDGVHANTIAYLALG
jgi:colanic acid biosynthesis protein WcaH